MSSRRIQRYRWRSTVLSGDGRAAAVDGNASLTFRLTYAPLSFQFKRQRSTLLPRTREGAERRETLVRNAAPLARHDAARQGHLARHPAPSNVGRSPRDAPPRRLVD